MCTWWQKCYDSVLGSSMLSHSNSHLWISHDLLYHFLLYHFYNLFSCTPYIAFSFFLTLYLAGLPDAAPFRNSGTYLEFLGCRADFGWYLWLSLVVLLKVGRSRQNQGFGASQNWHLHRTASHVLMYISCNALARFSQPIIPTCLCYSVCLLEGPFLVTLSSFSFFFFFSSSFRLAY